MPGDARTELTVHPLREALRPTGIGGLDVDEAAGVIGINSKKTGALRCTSGSTRQLLWAPPLVPGDPFRTNDATGSCSLMVQAIGHT